MKKSHYPTNGSMKLPKILESLLFVVLFCSLLGTTTVLIEYLDASRLKPFTVGYELFQRSTYSSAAHAPRPFFNGQDIKNAYLHCISQTKPQGTILLIAYLLTDRDITRALIAAHKNNVTVKVLVDKEYVDGEFSKIPDLIKAGIPVYISKSSKQHNKINISLNPDGTGSVITGSFNPTTSASTTNDENVVVLSDPEVVQAYENQFYKLVKNSILAPVPKSKKLLQKIDPKQLDALLHAP